MALGQNSFWNAYPSRPTAREFVRIFVVCIACDTELGFRAPVVDNVSDAEAERLFRMMGWTVLPTLCPDCNGARGEV